MAETIKAPTCEFLIRWAPRERDIVFCGTPATKRYPAAGGGYMHLCDEHSLKHLDYAEDVPDVR